MVNNEKERKDLMDAIRILLRTTEELKTTIAPLIRDQEDIFKILKSHEEAINLLMDRLLGTKEDHKKQSDALELMKTRIFKLEEKRGIHESRLELLEKRLKRIEFKEIGQILKRIDEKKVMVSDLKTVDELLLLHPDDENLLALKSNLLMELDRKKEALEVLEGAISKYSESASLWYERGLLLMEDFDESLKSFDRSLELIKDNPLLIHLVSFSRAILFARAGRFEEALQSAIRSVEGNPDCPNGWFLKGRILAELSRVPEALGCFDRAIELEKDFKEAWLEKGNALFILGPKYYDDAIVCYDTALKLDTKFAIAYFNKGKLLGIEERHEKALHTIDKGLEIEDKNPCAWCTRGITLNIMGRNNEALESFRKAFDLGPPKECRLLFVNTSVVLYDLGQYKEAVEMLDKVAAEPKNLEGLSPEMLEMYAELLYINKRYEEGAEIARKVTEAEPEKASAWNILALNLEALRNDEEALEAFETAVSLKESDEEITWYALAKLYERMGRKKEAEQAYQKFESTKKEAEHANDVEKY